MYGRNVASTTSVRPRAFSYGSLDNVNITQSRASHVGFFSLSRVCLRAPCTPTQGFTSQASRARSRMYISWGCAQDSNETYMLLVCISFLHLSAERKRVDRDIGRRSTHQHLTEGEVCISHSSSGVSSWRETAVFTMADARAILKSLGLTEQRIDQTLTNAKITATLLDLCKEVCVPRNDSGRCVTPTPLSQNGSGLGVRRKLGVLSVYGEGARLSSSSRGIQDIATLRKQMRLPLETLTTASHTLIPFLLHGHGVGWGDCRQARQQDAVRGPVLHRHQVPRGQVQARPPRHPGQVRPGRQNLHRGPARR